MSWHCRAWANNLIGQWPTYEFDDGDDWDAIYLEARCSSFSRNASASVDSSDEVYDWSLDDDSEAYCNEHDHAADWDEPRDIASDLEAAGFFTCVDCETVYHDETARHTHNNDEHGEDDIDINTITRWHTGRRTVPTSHSSWVTT